jgi:hypothetical protein
MRVCSWTESGFVALLLSVGPLYSITYQALREGLSGAAFRRRPRKCFNSVPTVFLSSPWIPDKRPKATISIKRFITSFFFFIF